MENLEDYLATDGGDNLWTWVAASDGQIPPGAEDFDFDGRHGRGKSMLYMVRAEHDGGMYPGIFLPEEGVVDIPVGGEVISKSEYEVTRFYTHLVEI